MIHVEERQLSRHICRKNYFTARTTVTWNNSSHYTYNFSVTMKKKNKKHPQSFTNIISQCVKTQCKLSLPLNQTQLQAHLFGRVPVILCQAAMHAGSTRHMCHQLSVRAPQTVSITKTHQPTRAFLFFILMGKCWRLSQHNMQGLMDAALSSFTIR